MEEEKKKEKKPRKRRVFRYAVSFTMRFDAYTVAMMDRIGYDEDKTRPEVIRSAIKYLFVKKYEQKELEKLRKKYRKDIVKREFM